MSKNKLLANDQRVQWIFDRYGLSILFIYSVLGMASATIDFMRSLDEKYNLVARFGLNRIW